MEYTLNMLLQHSIDKFAKLMFICIMQASTFRGKEAHPLVTGATAFREYEPELTCWGWYPCVLDWLVHEASEMAIHGGWAEQASLKGQVRVCSTCITLSS